MARKQKKTKEETSAENYFPVDRDDLKVTVEKMEKSQPVGKREIAKSVVEKVYKSVTENPVELMKSTRIRKPRRASKKTKPKFQKGNFSKKSAASTKKVYVYHPPKISLKPEGYELIITEKPQAALKIADALGKSVKRNVHGVPYYELSRQGKRIVVACAVGHLFSLSQNSAGQALPVFDISWKPNFMVRKKDFTKKYYDTILNLAKNAGSVTVATDYDVEGEVIGLNVVRYLCGQKDSNRMKFSTLTNQELNEAYDSKSHTLNWGQAIAGETRHYLDWYYGINLSRALMNAIRSTGNFKIMSIGRVQGPALNLIVKKEKEIQAFKPEPYWQVFITVKNSHILELKYIRDIFDKRELEKFKDLKGKTAIAKTEKTQQELPPNPPFNLTTLQTEAYKFYGITPSRALQIAQSLYLAGLISYPRTSSQKLPASIGYGEILKRLAKKYKVEHLIKKDKPIEGKKTDPAHPSIYPTGDSQILSGEEEKIYDLIVKRFLSLFCEDAIIDKKKVSAEVDGLIFSTLGSAIRRKAWMDIYPSKLKEVEIPDLEGPVKIINSKIEEKETQPPRRYSPASIVSELEKRNLGTKATRASILETLYDRGYIKEKSIEATPLGISLIETLENFSPIIIDEKLTRGFEDSLESITKSTSGFEEKEQKIIEKAKKTITSISKDFEKNEKEIGKELTQANERLWERQREENKLNICPVCKQGSLAITYSKKYRRHFVACDSYPKCKNTYSLPPDGLIKKTEKICEDCGFPILMRLKKGKSPWEFCFNKECPKNKERLEEYRKRQEESKNSQDS
jgi:DNA topoisomerase-1